MTRVLLTGGSGFIALHTLDVLLQHNHSVVTTVRSQEKADKITTSYPREVASGQLSFTFVRDIAQPGAFDSAVVSSPAFEVVVHTASPVSLKPTDDVQKDLIDPAVLGTTGILHSIKKYAPTVRRFVYTSSFAAMVHANKGLWPEHDYSEEDWNPITREEVENNALSGYRVAKTTAEKAAWKFLEDEKPGFTVATINPPVVFGAIDQNLQTLESLNTSNQRVLFAAEGKWKDTIPDTGVYLYVHVRDVAEAVVAAFERDEAANKRFFICAGRFSNKEIVVIVKKNFPEFKDIATNSTSGGNYPEGGVYGCDNTRSREVLGIKYRGLEESIVDVVKSLQAVGLQAPRAKL